MIKTARQLKDLICVAARKCGTEGRLPEYLTQ